MIVQKDIDFSKGLTLEQLEMLEKLKDFPDEPDEDFPELTDEQLAQMRRAAEINREERRKQTVTLRLSPQALRKAKSLGKGYTSVLSRILENALMDNEIIKKNL
ncbi:MAG: BrnA antitoxin family protein [Firmicutes bacterium]|nr:BrnA antitoxin family protein [Bacillota bacterium]MBQ7241859.1 BrnA antitoxin family protein [Bacillota bacterium]